MPEETMVDLQRQLLKAQIRHQELLNKKLASEAFGLSPLTADDMEPVLPPTEEPESEPGVGRYKFILTADDQASEVFKGFNAQLEAFMAKVNQASEKVKALGASLDFVTVYDMDRKLAEVIKIDRANIKSAFPKEPINEMAPVPQEDHRDDDSIAKIIKLLAAEGVSLKEAPTVLFRASQLIDKRRNEIKRSALASENVTCDILAKNI